VIPSAIDAWIWVGDMVYLDDPSVNCELVPTRCVAPPRILLTTYSNHNALDNFLQRPVLLLFY